ncbi:competence protein [Arcobacter suis]|uniref:Competence protein, ComEC family n=1 Tax=Arcobacter suis CECT 7833 TaxID=663365 RepID=A0AAD0SQL9_9BACT|nr:ComEC/Rec2 family competence protein [Arcobacter suis]AXX89844.1 competence protein, ComEC family [Arcobacter suis CECT 7833]RWS46436.1 competence protein [Arcobacter suis]
MIIKIKNYSKRIVSIILLILIFLINISIEYSKYLDFIDEEIYETKVEILNIYEKPTNNILRLKAQDFDFFANIDKSEEIKKSDMLNIAIVSLNISFWDYLKGFYTTIIYFDKIEKTPKFIDKIIEKINSNHEDEMIKELFQTLFLGTTISKELRDICTNYGISHVIALSGFHLAVLSFTIYWVLYFPYSFFHQRYFSYRNKKYDLILISLVFLFYYLILTDIIPSLLRAFVMLVLTIYFLRSNIKIVSYINLFYTFLIVIALFPKFLFSLGFWFSIIAVFYIFLFIQYFKNLNKYFQIIFFNVWMFLVFNPIVHFYFPQTTYEQFLSIIINILFAIFYVFEIIAHIFGFAIYFDSFIKDFLSYEMNVFIVKTPFYFLLIYIFVSFASIFNKNIFLIMNILMIFFNLFLYS